MSLLFKPKIKLNLKSDKSYKIESKNAVPRTKPWSTKELKQLINLKAIGLTYSVIGKILDRPAASCGVAVSTKNLGSKYKKRRMEMIKEIMSDD